MTTYTQMMITEAINEEQAREVRNLFDAHAADLTEPGFISSCRLSEADGRMVVFETEWADRRQALQYGSSRQYRWLVTSIQHLCCGYPVVKVFDRYSHDNQA